MNAIYETPDLNQNVLFSYSQGALVSSNNKADHHDIAEMLLKVALNTITILISYLLIILKYFFLFVFIKRQKYMKLNNAIF